MNKTRAAKHQFNLQQWKSIIQDCNASDLTINQYCEQNNLSRNSYFYWLKIIREEALEQSAVPGFVEVALPATQAVSVPVIEAVPSATPGESELTISVNGVSIIVTENTSAALLAKTIGVIRNA